MTFAFSSDWRGVGSYLYVRELDRAGFAWELLRRNPHYRKEAEDLPSFELLESGRRRVEAAPGPGPRWGLSFRASG